MIAIWGGSAAEQDMLAVCLAFVLPLQKNALDSGHHVMGLKGLVQRIFKPHRDCQGGKGSTRSQEQPCKPLARLVLRKVQQTQHGQVNESFASSSRSLCPSLQVPLAF